MTKSKKEVMIVQFKNQFISFDNQKGSSPSHIMYSWVNWVHRKWQEGMITLKDYKVLLGVDILKV